MLKTMPVSSRTFANRIYSDTEIDPNFELKEDDYDEDEYDEVVDVAEVEEDLDSGGESSSDDEWIT